MSEISPSPVKIPSDPKERAVDKGDVSKAALMIQVEKLNLGASTSKYVDADWENMTPEEIEAMEKKEEKDNPLLKNDDEEG